MGAFERGVRREILGPVPDFYLFSAAAGFLLWPVERVGWMFGSIDAGDDGFGLVVGRRWIVVALSVDGFACFVVHVKERGHFSFFGLRFWRRLGSLFLGLVVSFEVVFEHTVFAFEAALGGGEIAQDEVVGFDFVRLPAADGWAAVTEEMEVVFAFNAEATPFGLGGFDDKGIEDGIFGGILVGVEPGLEEFEPVGFHFAGEDEGGGAHAVAGGVAG